MRKTVYTVYNCLSSMTRYFYHTSLQAPRYVETHVIEGKGKMCSLCCSVFIQDVTCECVSPVDPNMAYMYPNAGTNAQAPPPGQAPPTTTPAYSSYQPTPTQGYQVREQLYQQFIITATESQFMAE